MTIHFTIPELKLNNAGTPPVRFMRNILDLTYASGEPAPVPPYQDIVLSGNGSLTLTNAKADGLNYLTLFGGCEQNGTSTPTTPVNIISNNGAIKYSANICNVNEQTALIGYYISNSGVVMADANSWIYQDYIPVKPNTTYTLSISTPVYYVTISEYSTTDDSGFIRRNASGGGENTAFTITTGSTTNYVRFGANIYRGEVTLNTVLAINWMLNVGDTMAYQPYVEGGIYTDGTVETVEVGSLFDSVDGQGTFVVPSLSNTTRIYKAFGQLPNGKYKVSITGNFEFIFQYKNTPEQSGNIGTWTTSEVYDLDNTGYYYGLAIRYPNNGNIQPSDFNGTITLMPIDNSATAEMLLKVGTYQDIQSVLDGEVTRNIGIKVFDGTETFINGQNGWITEDVQDQYWDNADPYAPICSHFVGTSDTPASNSNTVRVYRTSNQTGRIYFGLDKTIYTSKDVVKQWLAEQYNAGTPVIVIYPLATPTTETVTGQPLTIQAGTNTITITQASINNLPLEVSYKGIEGD